MTIKKVSKYKSILQETKGAEEGTEDTLAVVFWKIVEEGAKEAVVEAEAHTSLKLSSNINQRVSMI